MGLETQLSEDGAYRSDGMSVGMDEKRSLQRKSKHKRDELVARIMNSAALLKQERQDDLRRVTLTVAKRVESALKSIVGFLNTYFELLQFIEIIYITNKCNQ
jgi:hypothetical protein